MADATPVKIGFLLWPQTADWPALRDAAVRAEQAGAASLWTWDHLNSIVGPWEGPILEGWSVLAGWSQVTSRATLGLMVGANTFRNPGLTAKLAVTLDHLSGGRAILGIGGAWFEREHDAFGIDFGLGLRRAARPPRRVGRAPAAAARRRAGRGPRGRRVPDARCARRAAAGPAPPADHDRRVGAEEDASDPRPLRRPVEHLGLDDRGPQGEGRRAARAMRGDRPRPCDDREDRHCRPRHPRHARGGARRLQGGHGLDRPGL